MKFPIEVKQWNGENSLWIRIFGLFFGGSLRTKHAYIIYNGKPWSFQLQTWGIKFAYWK